MVNLDATVGGTSANSFLDVSAAIALLSGQLFATLPTAPSQKQQQALITATQHITRLRYRGVKTANAQALAFPRQLLPNPDMLNAVDALLRGGEYDYLTPDMYYASDAIPDRILLATALLADGLSKLSADPFRIDASSATVKRERLGPMETEYADLKDQPRGFALFPEVSELLAPLLLGKSTVVRRG